MKKFLFLLFFSFSTLALAAQEAEVKVKGMVCSFCAQGITKKFKAQTEVQDVKVSLETKLVTIYFKENQNLDDSKINEILTGAGYNVDKISRK